MLCAKFGLLCAKFGWNWRVILEKKTKMWKVYNNDDDINNDNDGQQTNFDQKSPLEHPAFSSGEQKILMWLYINVVQISLYFWKTEYMVDFAKKIERKLSRIILNRVNCYHFLVNIQIFKTILFIDFFITTTTVKKILQQCEDPLLFTDENFTEVWIFY